MPKVDSALWRDIMEYLRRRHAPICRQWFEQLQPVEMNSGLLKIVTRDTVQQNYLQRKCLDQFTEAAQAATGALVAVRFINACDEPGTAALLDRPAGQVPQPTRLGQTGNGAHGSNGSHAHVHGESPSAVSTLARPAVAPRQANTGSNGQGHGDWPHEHRGEDPLDQIVISPDYSFDTFVTGPGNRLAYAAAVAVASQPGTAYNPLFIHGGVGLGKTHLLQAVCQTIMQNQPGARICYLSCDAFMNHFLDCVQHGKMDQFRHHYRHVDVLVIDDIHFLQGKERTQEEFFHTFNELYQRNRQIVLSSDSPPSEIPQLEERLISRFGWGLVTNVTKPCYETRLAIVRAKTKLRGIDMPDEVVCYIASKIESNARELEGAITTIQGHAALLEKTITLELAQEALGEPARDSRHSQVTLQQIIDAVTAHYNVRLSDLQSKRRHKSITEPRQVCMWLARKRTRFSLEEIGGYFGGRDHTTVMHSIRTVDDRMGKDPGFHSQITQIEKAIQPATGSRAG